MKAGRGDISIIESTIHTSGLARTRLDFPCNCPSLNTIEQEVLLLLADEYHPTCSFSMINPGSLTMGFAEADPRQLAPSVGTSQVGITISADSSPAPAKTATPFALADSATRAVFDLFGSLGFMAHLPTFRPTFVDLRTGINLTFGAYKIYINHWGLSASRIAPEHLHQQPPRQQSKKHPPARRPRESATTPNPTPDVTSLATTRVDRHHGRSATRTRSG